MSDAERDVWRSPDGRYRLVAVVCDGKKGLTTYYTARTLRGGVWQPTTPYEAIDVLALLARQMDGDAKEERAGC